jgi:hypothetical protein
MSVNVSYKKPFLGVFLFLFLIHLSSIVYFASTGYCYNGLDDSQEISSNYFYKKVYFVTSVLAECQISVTEDTYNVKIITINGSEYYGSASLGDSILITYNVGLSGQTILSTLEITVYTTGFDYGRFMPYLLSNIAIGVVLIGLGMLTSLFTWSEKGAHFCGPIIFAIFLGYFMVDLITNFFGSYFNNLAFFGYCIFLTITSVLIGRKIHYKNDCEL